MYLIKIEIDYLSDNQKILKAVICAGLYPNVAKIKPDQRKTQEEGKKIIYHTILLSLRYDHFWQCLKDFGDTV